MNSETNEFYYCLLRFLQLVPNDFKILFWSFGVSPLKYESNRIAIHLSLLNASFQKYAVGRLFLLQGDFYK
jgi:hypothetical protein